MTTITESFNKADSSTLGPDLSWTELIGDLVVSSNLCANTGSTGNYVARADSTLSSSNTYAQCAVTTSVQVYAGVILRKDNTATDTKYEFYAAWASDNFLIQKRISGTPTSLATGGTLTGTTGGTVYGEVTGANPGTLTLKWDTVQQVQTTDSDIDTGTYAGVIIFNDVSSLSVTIDNFEAGDLAADVSAALSGSASSGAQTTPSVNFTISL